MKRIIALCLCITSILSATFSVNAENGGKTMTKAEQFMIGTGIFSMEYSPDKEISRGEFAKILSNALNLGEDDIKDEWQNPATGTDTTKEETTILPNVFNDVDASHPYYEEIRQVKQKQYMNGISGNLFAPENSITLKEAQKVILSALGYGTYAEMYGGYPDGYIYAAQEVGLTRNLSCATNDAMTHKDVIQIFYNALDTNLITLGDISKKEFVISDETFMTGVLNIGVARAIMTDNGFTAINGKTDLEPGKIKVGKIEAKLGKNAYGAVDYIGREVEMYYKQDDYGQNTAIFVMPCDEDVLTFNIEDFQGLKGNQISFYINGRSYTKNLHEFAKIIINNQYYSTFDEKTFDFAEGTVTLINNDGGYNTVVVNKYEFGIVSSIDSQNKIIYNKLRENTKNLTQDTLSVKYDVSGDALDKKAISLLDENGKQIEFNDFAIGDIINVRRSDNYLAIEKAGKVIKNVNVQNIKIDEDITTYTAGGESYETSEYIGKVKESAQVKNGVSYDFYFNKFGKIIFVENSVSVEDTQLTGILTRAQYVEDEDGNNVGIIKMYSAQGKLETYRLPEKIRVNGLYQKFEKVVEKVAKSEGKAILYKVDKEGMLTEITLPTPYGSTTEDTGWYEILPEGTYNYEKEGKSFDTIVYVTDMTDTFNIPLASKDYSNSKLFSLNATNYNNNEAVSNMTAYAKNKDAVIADVILQKTDVVGSNATIEDYHALIISDVVNTINDDGEPIVLFKGYKVGIWMNAQYMEYAVAEDANMISYNGSDLIKELEEGGGLYKYLGQDNLKKPGEKITAKDFGLTDYSEIEAGDIIQFGCNSLGEIKTIRMAYDHSEKQSFACGIGWGYDSDMNAPYHDGGHSNPHNVTFAGAAISRIGNAVKFATDFDPTIYNKTSDFEEIRKVVKTSLIDKTASIFVVEKRGKDVVVTSGTLDDIMTYEQTGDAKAADTVVSVTYQRAYNYGTVIYK